MATVKLLTINRGRLPSNVADRTVVVGYDMTPRFTSARWSHGCLEVSWKADSSGYVLVIWRCDDGQEVALPTATLLPREEPYLLSLELARGTLGRSRNWMDEWQRANAAIPTVVKRQSQLAHVHFARAVLLQHDPAIASLHAEHAIHAAYATLRGLGQRYAEIMLPQLLEQATSGSLVGCRWETVETAPEGSDGLLDHASIVSLGMPAGPLGTAAWTELTRRVGAARSKGQKVIIGPAVTPATITHDTDPSDTVVTCVGSPTTSAHLADIWHVTEGTNAPSANLSNTEQRLRSTARAIERFRQDWSGKIVMVSFWQPWGEYVAFQPDESPPLVFANALLRAGLGLSVVGLHLRFGGSPAASGMRDPQTVLRFIDRWSRLGLPLVILIEVEREERSESTHSASQIVQWIADELIPLLACHRSVTAILWNGWHGPVDGLALEARGAVDLEPIRRCFAAFASHAPARNARSAGPQI